MNGPTESFLYKLGHLEGEAAGERRGRYETVRRIYQRRLGRILTEPEKATLDRRLRAHDVDWALDVPENLCACALVAWFADPRIDER